MNRFPREGKSLEAITPELQRLARIWEEMPKMPFGSVITKPDVAAVKAYEILIESNYNNIGFIDNLKNHKIEGTNILGIEADALAMICDLYHGKDCSGYITSGGTEGNLMGLWLGREKLRDNGDILVVFSDLTHYSVEKVCNILELKNRVRLPVDKNHGIDISKLDDLISRKQYKSYIIVATLGYTETGTLDNIQKIADLIKKYRKNADFYLHIDAAIGGFVIPFSRPELIWDFSLNEVDSISADAHKLAAVPYPAGVFLARRRNYKKPKKIDYICQLDATFLGSRPGVSAAALYSVLLRMGFDGFKNSILSCLEMKKVFLEKISKYGAEIVDCNCMNSLAISFPSLGKKGLDKSIENKYSLSRVSLPNHGDRIFYPIFFMAHVKRSALDRFLEDLSRCLDG